MTNVKLNPNIQTVLIFLLFVLVCIPLFQDLGFLTIRNWDESRNIINAYEMYQNGNWLVPHFHGKPDMWNTKPPLLFWTQVISMKIFGLNELAFRLPSAFAALFTCGILFFFLKRYLGNIYIAIFSLMILISSTGYVRIHVTRSGDFDALLILFTTISALSFFLALNYKKPKFIYLFYIAITFAVLTKGVAGLLFLPGYFLYGLFTNNLKFIFTNKHFYLGFLILFVFGIGYYPFREMINPGFLEAVFNNELGGRFLEGVDNNDKRPFNYYLKNIIERDFKSHYLTLILGGAFSIFTKEKKIKQLVLFSTLVIASFLLIISLSKTKLSWYDSPVYPFMSIIAGCGIYFIYNFITLIINENLFKNSDVFSFKNFNQVLLGLLVFRFLFIPYLSILEKTKFNEERDWARHEYKLTYFLRDALNGKHDLKEIDNSYIVLNPSIPVKPQLEFYQLLLKKKGVEITIKEKDKLTLGDIVYAYQDEVNNYLKENYEIKLEKEYKDNINYMFLKKYEILKKKEKK